MVELCERRLERRKRALQWERSHPSTTLAASGRPMWTSQTARRGAKQVSAEVVADLVDPPERGAEGGGVAALAAFGQRDCGDRHAPHFDVEVSRRFAADVACWRPSTMSPRSRPSPRLGFS